jgi:formyltetrahydrofolate-dependent phosphoribosylglycinamide formyltransferase
VSHLRIAFFVSGNGSLFENLTQRFRAGEADAETVVLISSSSDAFALQRAAKLGVPAVVIQRSDYADGNAFCAAILQALAKYNVNFVCLAGYMKMVPPELVRHYRNRILNIHPALIPAFCGKGMYGHFVHEAVLQAGVRISGVTVHLVDEEYDHGPIVLQRGVFVNYDDTADSLGERVHDVEYQIYMDAIKLFAQERIVVDARRTRILPGKFA